jgi:hypothetical protein
MASEGIAYIEPGQHKSRVVEGQQLWRLSQETWITEDEKGNQYLLSWDDDEKWNIALIVELPRRFGTLTEAIKALQEILP